MNLTERDRVALTTVIEQAASCHAGHVAHVLGDRYAAAAVNTLRRLERMELVSGRWALSGIRWWSPTQKGWQVYDEIRA